MFSQPHHSPVSRIMDYQDTSTGSKELSIGFPVCNESLTDELQALNAIYGDHSAIVTSSTTVHTTVELRPPGEECGYLLHVPKAYPRSPPQLVGIDPLHLSTDRTYRRSCVYFKALLFNLHQPGEVVLFDAIEALLSINSQRRLLGWRSEYMSALKDMPTRKLSDKLQSLADIVAMKSLKAATHGKDFVTASIVTCSVCMEALFTIDAATLSCRHSYCASCVQQGLQNMYSNFTPLRCCGKPFSYKTIAQFGDLEPEVLERYTNWFLEFEAENPLYCSNIECSVFISLSNRNAKMGSCPKCGRHTCVHCKEKDTLGTAALSSLTAFLESSPGSIAQDAMPW